MHEYGIKASDRVICFGQLLGMCDQVSFSLGKSYNKTFNDVAYGMVSFCEINIKDYKVLKSNQELSGERD